MSSARFPYDSTTALQVFTEDSQHRCTDVVLQVPPDPSTNTPEASELEHWTWVGDQLISRVVTDGADPTVVRSEATYTYDADGTLASTVVDGYSILPRRTRTVRASHDGVADYVVRSVALGDGSRWVESLELGSKTPDANVVRDGKLTPAARLRWNDSPACRMAQPPRRTSHRCQFERTTFQISVRWDDPYVTPNLR